MLIDPVTFGNVSGGFGFVGAAYEVALTWTPSPLDLAGGPFRLGDPSC